MTYEEKREAVSSLLRESPSSQDWEIAETCNVLITFVTSIRKFLGIPQPEMRATPKNKETVRYVEPITDPDVYFAKNKRKTHNQVQERLEDIMELIRQGLELQILANQLDLSIRQVQYTLRINGMTFRQIRSELGISGRRHSS